MKKYFLTGLVTLLPLAVTIWVARFFIELLTHPFIGFVSPYTKRVGITSPQLTHTLSQIVILIILFFVTFFLGFFARKFFFHQIIRMWDKLFDRIPLVGKVYKTAKEIVKSLIGPEGKSFKEVVLLPFPYRGAYCLGLISKEAPLTCSKGQNGKILSVFVPTSPNPSTGFLLLCHESELIPLKMKADEAIKYVLSCAVIQPEAQEP